MSQQQDDSQREEMIRYWTRFGQNPKVVRMLLPRIESVVVPGETIQAFFIQKKPIHNDVMIVTKRRLFIYRPKYFGGSWMEEFAWQYISGARMEHNPIYSTLYLKFSPRSGEPIHFKFDWLPRLQVLDFYRLAKEMDDYWYDENRVRDLQAARAKSGGWMGGMNIREISKPAVPHWNDPKIKKEDEDQSSSSNSSDQPQELPSLPSTLSGSPPQLIDASGENSDQQIIHQQTAESLTQQLSNEIVSQITPQLQAYSEQISSENNAVVQSGAPALMVPYDPHAALRELKELLEEQLITPEEYEEKKRELLSKL